MATSHSSRSLFPFLCRSCRQRLLPQPRRAFTTTVRARAADGNANADADADPFEASLARLGKNMQQRQPSRARSAASRAGNPFTSIMNSPASVFTEEAERNLDRHLSEQPHRLHVYAHKHNTHLTLVQPPRSAADTASSRIAGAKVTSAQQKKVVDTVLSLSTGNLGFRKSGRGSYDAAFQLAAFALKQIQERGMYRDIRKLEVVLRGFGAGREAVTKALLGREGRHIRQRITAVVDATRLKQGGTRSKKPRRLG